MAPQAFPSFSLQPPSPLRERTPGERPTELHLTAMLPSGDFSMLAAPQAYSDSEGADPLEALDDDDDDVDEAHDEGALDRALEGLHDEVYEGEAPYDDEAFADEADEAGSSCTEAGALAAEDDVQQLQAQWEAQRLPQLEAQLREELTAQLEASLHETLRSQWEAEHDAALVELRERIEAAQAEAAEARFHEQLAEADAARVRAEDAVAQVADEAEAT
ncbi:hypothetical protein Ctob_011726 [Chrysochromulina tobinii]|uniref:Uncharacterized protein n=1 Tax=Chrysochromulina tobinii TaxID=1460289 RepID=A0A0M0JTQ8_9EUKA|nr:hypothetical protein Ctob_011726 [Chrysochromulina tobinii]|eukprot:KOO29732.1 hypothetical protein Ctob_011726 [Chrysochromulina sp. CCMP291]